MKSRVSLSDIAEATGYAVPTVSLALRGIGTISPKARKRIKEAAEAMGYYPNPLLAALASKHFSGRPKGISLAFLRCPDDPGAEEIQKRMLGSCQEHARKLGYFLEIFDVNAFKDGASCTQILFSRGIQGIMLPHQFRLEMLPGMDWHRFSVVGVSESTLETPDAPQPQLYRTAVDHFGLTVHAWNETWRRGYRRIGFGFIHSSELTTDDILRQNGAEVCAQRASPSLRIPSMALKTPMMEPEREKFRKWMESYKPDAVIGFNNSYLWLLLHEGFQVPEDVGFVSLHVPPTGLFGEREVTESGMKPMGLESLFAAVELLDDQIRRHQYGLPRHSRTVMVHSEWVDGETLPPKIPRTD